MTINREHLKGLELAKEILGGYTADQVSDSPYIAITDAIADAQAAPVAEPVAEVVWSPANTRHGAFMALSHSENFAAGTKLYTAPPIIAAPEAEPVALPDGVHIDKDFLGTVHIKFGEFDFIQIQYDHRYTYNSHQDWVARRIVASLAEDSPDVSQWRGLAAALYQACGAYDMPPRVLDALSAAANGEQFGHLIGALPPCSPTAPQHDAELVELLDRIVEHLEHDAIGSPSEAIAGDLAEDLRARLATLSAKP